jgi:hypothetical protein
MTAVVAGVKTGFLLRSSGGVCQCSPALYLMLPCTHLNSPNTLCSLFKTKGNFTQVKNQIYNQIFFAVHGSPESRGRFNLRKLYLSRYLLGPD